MQQLDSETRWMKSTGRAEPPLSKNSEGRGLDLLMDFRSPVPSRLNVMYLDKIYNLGLSEFVQIGRTFQYCAETVVAGRHLILGRDAQGVYVLPQATAHGTFLRRYKFVRYQRLAVKVKYYAQAGDVVYLGGSTGPAMTFVLVPES